MLEILQSTYTKSRKRPLHDMENFPVSQRDTSSNLTGSWRTLLPVFQEGVAPCSQACPAQPYIPKYMGLVREGKLKEALGIIREQNPLPAVCGRVCPHFCEESCNRGGFDEQVSIHVVERFIGDYGLDIPHQEIKANTTGKVAVIGSGPAGLSASYFLARQGVVVDLYEREAKAGGLLRYGIPEYRLPRDILDREIENILALGINFLNEQGMVPENLPSLIEKYDFVFYSPGLWGRNIPKWEYSGEKVFDGLDVLREIHKGNMPPLGNRVAVVGGGSTAMDVARVLKRFGKEVTIVYRRTLADAPAFVDEIQETVEEGIQILEEKLITRMEDQSDGSLMVEIQGVIGGSDGNLLPDGEKIRRMVDSVVAAVGQIPETDLEKGTKVFLGGDYETSAGTVVHAIASGKRGASAILEKMGLLKKDQTDGSSTRSGRGPGNKIVGYDGLNTVYFKKSKRLEPEKQDCETRTGNFCEIEPQASKKAIIAEADRCLSCGTCTLCETCWYFCPDACVTTNLNSRKIHFDTDFCKGCAVCSVVCPRGCITMVEEQ